ncbi:unnamed protein product [Microthlaspi erraticum]|uniref:Uncharacterized protein n=1 Tax=Microthlaspi erraticum TaxID=1685480 RepID=A0A6D2IXU7_9BRAS|nr:unnamed protein product [Microthlaspi erraticum]
MKRSYNQKSEDCPDGSIENQRPTAQSGWPRKRVHARPKRSVRLKSRPKSKPSGRSRTTRETCPAVGQATPLHAAAHDQPREPGSKPRGRATFSRTTADAPSEPGRRPGPAENHRPIFTRPTTRPTANPSGHDRSDRSDHGHDPIVADRPNAAVDPKPVLKPISYFQARLNPKPPQKT